MEQKLLVRKWKINGLKKVILIMKAVIYYLNFGFEFSVITYGIVDFHNPRLGNKRLISWQEHKLWETKVGCTVLRGNSILKFPGISGSD